MEFEHLLEIVLVQYKSAFVFFFEWDTEAGLDVDKLSIHSAQKSANYSVFALGSAEEVI